LREGGRFERPFILAEVPPERLRISATDGNWKELKRTGTGVRSMVWYGKVNVDSYSAIITKFSNNAEHASIWRKARFGDYV